MTVTYRLVWTGGGMKHQTTLRAKTAWNAQEEANDILRLSGFVCVDYKLVDEPAGPYGSIIRLEPVGLVEKE